MEADSLDGEPAAAAAAVVAVEVCIQGRIHCFSNFSHSEGGIFSGRHVEQGSSVIHHVSGHGVH